MLGRKFGTDSDQLPEFDQQEEIAAEKRALRELRDTFRAAPETLFEETIELFDSPDDRKIHRLQLRETLFRRALNSRARTIQIMHLRRTPVLRFPQKCRAVPGKIRVNPCGPRL